MITLQVARSNLNKDTSSLHIERSPLKKDINIESHNSKISFSIWYYSSLELVFGTLPRVLLCRDIIENLNMSKHLIIRPIQIHIDLINFKTFKLL